MDRTRDQRLARARRSGEEHRDIQRRIRLELPPVAHRARAADDDTAATRVWAAGECLKKAGATLNAPLVLSPSPAKAPDGWVLLSSGRLTSATFVGPVRGVEGKLALAIVLSSKS